MSAGYPLYKESFVHSYLTVGGKKISKSLGNVITPKELSDKYGVDGARYLILSNFPYKDDADVTWDMLDEKYNADLANGIGNTVSRIAKLAENSDVEFSVIENSFDLNIKNFRVDIALRDIWKKLKSLDKHVNENKPWGIKNKTELHEVLHYEINELLQVATCLEPFMPHTAEKIKDQFGKPKIKSQEWLFPRI